MALDQEYYEKALGVLLLKGFSDTEAEQIARTLSVLIPMRFITAKEWDALPADQRLVNEQVEKNLTWLDRIPELQKPVIYKMPTDFTYTTYGQEYVPGTDSPTFKTGPDGYTHHPVGWESGILGMPGTIGAEGISFAGHGFVRNEFKYVPAVEPLTKRIMVRMAAGGRSSDLTLNEFIERIGGYGKLPMSVRQVIDDLCAAEENGMNFFDDLPALPGGVSKERAAELKLDNLADLDGIKRAYPDINDADANTISNAHRLVDQHLGRAKREHGFSPKVRDAISDVLISLNGPRKTQPEASGDVKIKTHFTRNFGYGLSFNEPLFGQSFKYPTGPQTMPGLERGPDGKRKRRKKGKR